MQAPNLGTLLDLESPLEAGVQAAFDALDLTAYTELNASEEFQKKRPRIEVRARIGAGNGHVYVSQPTGQEQEDQWECTIELNCLVAPSNLPENNKLLPQLAAAVRQFAGQIGQTSVTDINDFPYHCFMDNLKSVGTEYTVDPTAGASQRTMTFRGTWGIRSNAWPAGF